jgi:RNA polymerase sigma-70 factor (ECF subfamily)
MSPTRKSQWVLDALARHERPLIRYAKWLVGDLESARDIVQETFLRLCREDPARLEGRVAPWLFSVCRNLAIDARRKAVPMTSLDATEASVPCDLDERHDSQQALGRILEVVATLPRNQREVIYLKFQGGLSYKEISAITELSVTNVGFLLHTAMRAIRSRLSADAPGAGHEYASNQSDRSEMDRIRTGGARRG